MREILFRGKRADNGEWVNGSFVLWFDGSTSIDTGKPADPLYAVIPDTVGQYTGLTDKNGVKIFEGDIVSVEGENGGELYRFFVKFGECGGVKSEAHEEVGFMGFYFEGTITTCAREFFLRQDPVYWLNAYKCVVIGNIHDNPELIEG